MKIQRMFTTRRILRAPQRTQGNYLIAMTSVLCMLVSCSSEKLERKSETNEAGNPVEKNPFGSVTDQTLPSAQNDIGDVKSFNFERTAVRNFEELKSSMGVVTCVSDSDKLPGNNSKTFGAYFTELTGNLPTTNDPQKYIAANIVGTMNLASKACELSVLLSSAARCEWTAGLRNESDPAVAFTDENIELLGKAMVEHFWGIDPSFVDENSQYLVDLKKDVAGLKSDVTEHIAAATAVPANQKNRKVVEGVLVSLCSAALSSSQFTTY